MPIQKLNNPETNGGYVGPTVTTQGAVNTSESITTFNAPGTFTAINGITQVDLLVVAGGGGSAGATHNSGGCSGSGGGGMRVITSHPVPASPIAVTVGAGGSGATGNANGSPGNPSSFASSTPIAASGGGYGGGGG